MWSWQLRLVLLAIPAIATMQWPFQTASSDSNGAKDTPHDPLTKYLEDYIYHLLDVFKLPSLTLAVIDGDETFSAGYGKAVLPSTNATPETLYYTGSTTKSFTAAALTMLADGRFNATRPLRLTDPLSDHLNFFKLANDYASTHITIEDALSHRSGLPRHDLAYDDGDYTVEDLIEALPHLALTEEPRTTFQYCNIMYMLLSRVVENAANTSLGDFLTDRLWTPLGMNATYFSLAAAQRAEKERKELLAVGYYWDLERQIYRPTPWLDSPIVAGAGHTISNVQDYARYLRAMIRRSAPISKTGHEHLRTARTIIYGHGAGPFPAEEAFEQANAGFAYAFPGPFTYTLGWEQRVYRGVEMYLHDGAVFGFGALMAYVPSLDWGIAMTGNTEQRSNLVQTIVLYRLLDDKLNVAEADRQQYEDVLRDAVTLGEILWRDSSSRLYPDVMRPPLPLTRSLEAYTGVFWHEGYRNLSLSLGSATYPGARNTTVLCAESWNKVWKAALQFEHVSGDHFVLWSLPLESRPSQISKGAMRAEFRIGVSGRVEAVGVEMAGLKEGAKIWFERQK